MKTVAVLLLTMGGPWTQKDVFPFLFNLFSDRAIVPLPWGLRHGLAFLIALGRRAKASKNYALIGGGSPLLKNTEAQARALEKQLSQAAPQIKFFIMPVMRYAPPRMKDVWRSLKHIQPDICVAIPMYPQYSTTTTQSSLEDCLLYFRRDKTIPLLSIPPFFADPLFIDALARQTKPYWDDAQKYKDPILVLTAHGLPHAVIRKGDPYQKQCETTAQLVCEKMELSEDQAVLAYQSRIGPVRWIGPFLEDVLQEQGREGRGIVILPISFVADHVETLVELALEAKKRALEAGSPYCAVVPALGDDGLFIENLANKVLKLIK